MSRYYWHNISKGEYNNNDMQDFIESCVERTDRIKFSERGCAIVYDLDTLEQDEFNEFKRLKKEFLECFEEFHGISFYKPNPSECSHKKTIKKQITYEGSYYDRTRYVTETICLNCNKVLDKEEKIGDYG